MFRTNLDVPGPLMAVADDTPGIGLAVVAPTAGKTINRGVAATTIRRVTAARTEIDSIWFLSVLVPAER